MPEAKILGIASQKGGVGKTTTAAALIAGLTLQGYRVLGIDTDAQANLTHTMQGRTDGHTVKGVLLGSSSAKESIQETPCGYLIAGDNDILTAEAMLMPKLDRHTRLKNALGPVMGAFDYIIIDTPPSLGIATANALMACHKLIVPSGADIYSLQGIAQLAETVGQARNGGNHSLAIAGILLTRHSPRSILSQEGTGLAEQIASSLGTKVFTTRIREGVAIKEAQMSQKDIFSWAPTAKVTGDYKAFIEELLQELRYGQ